VGAAPLELDKLEPSDVERATFGRDFSREIERDLSLKALLVAPVDGSGRISPPEIDLQTHRQPLLSLRSKILASCTARYTQARRGKEKPAGLSYRADRVGVVCR
jgi:hypothetical protein